MLTRFGMFSFSGCAKPTCTSQRVSHVAAVVAVGSPSRTHTLYTSDTTAVLRRARQDQQNKQNEARNHENTKLKEPGGECGQSGILQRQPLGARKQASVGFRELGTAERRQPVVPLQTVCSARWASHRRTGRRTWRLGSAVSCGRGGDRFRRSESIPKLSERATPNENPPSSVPRNCFRDGGQPSERRGGEAGSPLRRRRRR